MTKRYFGSLFWINRARIIKIFMHLMEMEIHIGGAIVIERTISRTSRS